jgi:hypothetical protein
MNDTPAADTANEKAPISQETKLYMGILREMEFEMKRDPFFKQAIDEKGVAIHNLIEEYVKSIGEYKDSEIKHLTRAFYCRHMAVTTILNDAVCQAQKSSIAMMVQLATMFNCDVTITFVGDGAVASLTDMHNRGLGSFLMFKVKLSEAFYRTMNFLIKEESGEIIDNVPYQVLEKLKESPVRKLFLSKSLGNMGFVPQQFPMDMSKMSIPPAWAVNTPPECLPMMPGGARDGMRQSLGWGYPESMRQQFGADYAQYCRQGMPQNHNPPKG